MDALGNISSWGEWYTRGSNVKYHSDMHRQQAAGSMRLVDLDKVSKPSWVFRVVKDLRVSGNVVEGEARPNPETT